MALHEGTSLFGLEYSVHGERTAIVPDAACPAKVQSEVASVLPSADISKLLIVPTCQRAVMDLVQTGEQVEHEKDKLLEQFMAWSKKVCSILQEQGHWSDYIDPCSGLAVRVQHSLMSTDAQKEMVHQDSTHVYNEVEALSVLCNYKTANAGCCKVLLHPQWGSAVYPATMFTCAPLELLLAAIKRVEETGVDS